MKITLLFLLLILLISCGESGPTEPDDLSFNRPVLGRVFVYESYEYDDQNVKSKFSVESDSIFTVDTTLGDKRGVYATVDVRGQRMNFYYRDSMGDILIPENNGDSLSWFKLLPLTSLKESNDTIRFYDGLYKMEERIVKSSYLENETIKVNSEDIKCKKFSFSSQYKIYSVVDGKYSLQWEGPKKSAIIVFSPLLGVPCKAYYPPTFDSINKKNINGYMRQLINFY